MKLALALLLVTFASIAADPMSLKGIRVGMTRAEAKAAAPHLFDNCGGSRPELRNTCYFSRELSRGREETVAAKPIRSWMTTFDDNDRVASVFITMPEESFTEVMAALIERWGKPTKVEDSTVQNRMGAKFDQSRATWIGDQVLTVRRRSGKVDEMSISLTTPAVLEKNQEERKQQAKDAAKDL